MARTKKETLPPPGNHHRYDWSAMAAARKREPLRWQRLIEQGPYSSILPVKAGQNRHFQRDDGFEVTTRRNSPDRRPGVRRTCDLWVRYRPDWDMNLSPEQRTEQYEAARREQDAEADHLG